MRRFDVIFALKFSIHLQFGSTRSIRSFDREKNAMRKWHRRICQASRNWPSERQTAGRGDFSKYLGSKMTLFIFICRDFLRFCFAPLNLRRCRIFFCTNCRIMAKNRHNFNFIFLLHAFSYFCTLTNPFLCKYNVGKHIRCSFQYFEPFHVLIFPSSFIVCLQPLRRHLIYMLHIIITYSRYELKIIQRTISPIY